MQTRTETINAPSGPMGVHVVRPDGDGPFPVVVFFHHGPGLDDGSKDTMSRIAEWGYYVVTHDREMVDRMRRRVVELYEGRVIRDEVAGGYTEESTTEFGVRMRAEMGVGVEGHTNGNSGNSGKGAH